MYPRNDQPDKSTLYDKWIFIPYKANTKPTSMPFSVCNASGVAKDIGQLILASNARFN